MLNPSTHDGPTGDEDEQSSRTHSATHFGGVGAALDTQGMTIGGFPFLWTNFLLKFYVKPPPLHRFVDPRTISHVQ